MGCNGGSKPDSWSGYGCGRTNRNSGKIRGYIERQKEEIERQKAENTVLQRIWNMLRCRAFLMKLGKAQWREAWNACSGSQSWRNACSHIAFIGLFEETWCDPETNCLRLYNFQKNSFEGWVVPKMEISRLTDNRRADSRHRFFYRAATRQPEGPNHMLRTRFLSPSWTQASPGLYFRKCFKTLGWWSSTSRPAWLQPDGACQGRIDSNGKPNALSDMKGVIELGTTHTSGLINPRRPTHTRPIDASSRASERLESQVELNPGTIISAMKADPIYHGCPKHLQTHRPGCAR